MNQKDIPCSGKEFESALRIVPRRDRERCREEWCADLLLLQSQGNAIGDYISMQRKMALRLRMQDISALLFGGRGPAMTLLLWSCLLVLIVLGGPVVAIAVLLGMTFFAIAGGAHSAISHWSSVAAVIVGITAATLTSFSAYEQGIAADESRSPAAWSNWWWLGTILVLLAVIVGVRNAVIAVKSDRRRSV